MSVEQNNQFCLIVLFRFLSILNYILKYIYSTLNLYGDVTIDGKITDNAKIYLKGDKKQTITKLDTNNLIIENTSNEGVDIKNTIYVRKFIENLNSTLINGKNIELSGNINGKYHGDITLNNPGNLLGNVTIDGNTYFIGSTFIPNKTSLTINGNAEVTTKGKCLDIEEGAKVIVKKDLLVTNLDGWFRPYVKISGELIVKGNADFTRPDSDYCWGGLSMTTPNAVLTVYGDLVGLNQIDTRYDTYITNGNGDGQVNIRDVTLIQMYCASLISNFKKEA